MATELQEHAKERREREELKRRKHEEARIAAVDVWLSFADLQKAGICPNWPTCLAWQRDPQIAFPFGKLLGPNSRRWAKREIENWLSSRPIAREDAEQAA